MLTAYDLFSLKTLVPSGQAHSVTIGNFDGVHAGHRCLIARTREKGNTLGVPSAIVTFDPHPQQVLGHVQAPAPLLNLTRKLDIFAELGLDLALVLPFTEGLAALAPEEFVHSVLLEGLNMKSLVTGYDFALGKDRQGTFSLLSQLGENAGYAAEQLAPLRIHGETVSSSRIREYIRAGDVEAAIPLLRRPHSVEGAIIHGLGRGKGLGFPTINIAHGGAMLPASGVYAVLVEIAPMESTAPLLGVANIGTNPTFDGKVLSLEANILDFSRDVYGCSARISFMKRLRGEVRFPGPEALVEQMTADIRAARTYLPGAAAALPLPPLHCPSSKESS